MYYGWKIVGALFVTLTFSSGLGFYNHAVMLQALVAEKNFSIEAASSAVSIFFLASGLVGMYIASLLDKSDVRWVITGGAILASTALISIRFASTDWQVLVAYALFGVGFAASGLLSATTLITRWFTARRAAALSITSTGLSVGGIVITPGSALFIESYGIDTATLVFAAVYFVGVVPLTWIYLRSWPADMGLKTDGGALTPGTVESPTGTMFKDSLKDHYFWALSFAYIFLMLAQVGSLAHQYGLVGEHLTGKTAAAALGIIPIASIIGRLAGGALLSYVSTHKFAISMMLLQSLSLLFLSQSTGIVAFTLGLALFGISVGNLLMLQPLLIAETYGQIHYGKIYGLSNMMTTFGIAFGPFLMGLIYAHYSAYSYSYVAASAAGMTGFIIYRFWGKMPNTPKTPSAA